MACVHVNSPELNPPRPTQSVYREDCTQCFDSIDDPTGLNVCLYCFNGGCTGERNHGLLHHKRSTHPLAVNIKRTKKHKQREEPPQKMTKLEIAAETEADRYDTTTQVICYSCGVENIDPTSGRLPVVVDGILHAMTFARQEEVKAWEQEFIPCEHTLLLQQQSSRKIESQDLGQCSMCDLKENLWLCLECGNLGCGRDQYGGGGGNSHGLAHTDQTGHGVAVKLGSITPDGTADVYCYKCREERVDPELGAHLAHWGINIAEREKTEKSLTELQIEQNMKYDFSMTTEDGKELEPIFGKGFTGLRNLGNSCYLASITQCLFSLPAFKTRYNTGTTEPPLTNTPAEDLETQLRKIADGLLSGRYSHPDNDSTSDSEVSYQKGLAPAMLKHLIGRGHEEFSTMRQQDSFELLLHLFKLISLSQHTAQAEDPVKSFRFVMEQRLQCLNCKKVRYSTDEQDNISIPVPARRIKKAEDGEDKKDEFESVSLKECLDIFTASEVVDLTCSSCGSKDGFTKRSLFKTFPQNLAINARRFEVVNWVPTKLDIPVEVTDEVFDMSLYKSNGLQPGEEELPQDAAPSTVFVPNEGALEMLEGMGFPRVRAEKGLHATGNADPEAAMNWLIAHLEDPDIDTPVQLSIPGDQSAGSGGAVDPEKISQLADMGILPEQARKALKETGGDVERAVDWVFSHPDDPGETEEDHAAGSASDQVDSGPKPLAGSEELPANFRLQCIVCHKGSSIHAGHYVAFIRKHIPDTPAGEKSWVLFNDEKVVKAFDFEELKKTAYVYFFGRA